MKKFAVFGNPIAHSLSPLIHQMFAESCGEVIDYDKRCGSLKAFESEVNDFFFKEGALGGNFTVPFKERVFALADEHDAAAKLAGAANTLHRQPSGNLKAYNTDGIGLVNDLLAHQVPLQNSYVLILGAGGATRGVIHPLLNAGVAHIYVLNRSKDKAIALVEEANDLRVTALDSVDAPLPNPPSVVINSTSASLNNTVPAMPDAVFSSGAVAYDMVYGASATVFMQKAKALGSQLQLDGLGMLVEQAAAAFSIWTGQNPPTDKVAKVLRDRISGQKEG